MANIIDFEKYRDKKAFVKESVSLGNWVSSFRTDDELREAFLNIDRAMKYVHEHGYCVKSFDPNEIEILNNSLNQIKFNKLLEMPNEIPVQSELVKEDIYRSSFIQIGIYTKCLPYLDPKFLKSNFDSFATFLPEGDVPYYRGVIERGASVYFCEYALEKKKRDLKALENEVGGQATGMGRQLVKSNGQSLYDDTRINDAINDNIYSQINKKTDAAFVNFLIYPTIVMLLGVVLTILAFLMSIN